jgi:hypothetical protein
VVVAAGVDDDVERVGVDAVVDDDEVALDDCEQSVVPSEYTCWKIDEPVRGLVVDGDAVVADDFAAASSEYSGGSC